MRGLLYKEFHQFKADFYVLAGLLAFFCGLCITSAVTAEAETPQDLMMAITMISSLIYFLVLFLGSILCSEFFTKDEKRPWNHFAMSLPLAVKGQVQAKYYAVLVVHLMVLFACFVTDVVIVVVSGNAQHSAIAVGVIMFSFRMLVMAFEIPFMFRFGAQQGMNVEGAFLTLFFIVLIIYGLFGDISFFLQENVWKAFMEWILSGNVIWILALLPYVAAVAYYVSYRISLKLYRKGVEYSGE